jgi:multidrug resistance efflux pump
MARGFTDAPAGTVVLFGEGSTTLLELRVTEGQHVKRGDVIAVLSNYPLAEIGVRMAEAELAQAQNRRDGLAAGIRMTKKVNVETGGGAGSQEGVKVARKSKDPAPPKVGIPEQEALVRLSTEQHKLKVIEMQRSGVPSGEKDLEISISEQKAERDRAELRVLKETLASDLAESDTDISIKSAALEKARVIREQALVRSPLDGVVAQILTRPGERIDRGIAQIVDMSKLRVLADVDEVLLGRIVLGAKVDVVFHGETTIHTGKVVRVAATVQRMLSMGSLGSGSTNLKVVQVEVVLDDPSQMPEMVGREAEVTFL